MNDAVRYLLPAIPTLLYGGLGRHQVDRLAVLRKACERTWERLALGRTVAVDFATLFQDVLTQFDTQPDDFSPQREIGRAHGCTPVTTAHLVCRLLLEKKEHVLRY